MNLEVVLVWHASTYLCTLVGCSRDVPQTNMGGGNSHDVDIELEGDGALHIHADAPIIAYLWAYEIYVGLTPKEWDWVVHKAKWFKWEGNSLLHVWVDGQVWVVPRAKNVRTLLSMCMKSWAILGFDRSIVCFRTILVVRDGTLDSTICFLVFGVWSSMNFIQCTDISSLTIAYHGA